MKNIFHKNVINGVTVSWCTQYVSDDLDRMLERIVIHSIIDPERESPACRISDNGFEYIEPEIPEYPEPDGLIVFGWDKYTRFSINEVIEQYPEYTDVLNELKIIIQQRQAAAILGKKGGSAKTEAKAVASRENGKKGGRPKMLRFFNCSRKDVESNGYTVPFLRVSEYDEKPTDAVGTWKPIPGDDVNVYYVFPKKQEEQK